MNEPKDYVYDASHLPAVLGLVLLCLGAVMFLAWCGRQASAERALLAALKTATIECQITNSYLYLSSGWKVMDPADRQTVGILVGAGKAEQKSVDDLVECTRYQDGATPVTSRYALVMWRPT